MNFYRELLNWEQMGVWGRWHVDRLRLLREADKWDVVMVRAFGVLLESRLKPVNAFSGSSRDSDTSQPRRPPPQEKRGSKTRHQAKPDELTRKKARNAKPSGTRRTKKTEIRRNQTNEAVFRIRYESKQRTHLVSGFAKIIWSG